MTRINLVSPASLADQHLFAEWREIKMVPAALRRSLKTQSLSGVLRKVSNTYTLNTGHVTFFYDKMSFLSKRYAQLTRELLDRNYSLGSSDSFSEYTNGLPIECFGDRWVASPAEIKINVDRVSTRLRQRPDWYRYYGKAASVDYLEALLKLEYNFGD